jgi:hypothetical protein
MRFRLLGRRRWIEPHNTDNGNHADVTTWHADTDADAGAGTHRSSDFDAIAAELDFRGPRLFGSAVGAARTLHHVLQRR